MALQISTLLSTKAITQKRIGFKIGPKILAANVQVNTSTCERDNAFFTTTGKPCRKDLPEVIYDERIGVINRNGARYMVCAPSKNGSTYHYGILIRILGGTRYNTKGGVHKNLTLRNEMVLQNYPNDDIASFFGDKTLKKYAIIRNPVIRTLSGYLNTLEDKEQNVVRSLTNPEAFQEWIKKQYPPGYSVLSELDTHRKKNQHVRTQLQFCCFRYADFRNQWTVFKFEEPEKYLDYIYDTVPHEYLKDGWGLGQNKNFRDFVLGPKTRTNNPEQRFAEYIGSLEMFEYLVKAMEDETKFFGYEEDVAELRRKMQEYFSTSNR